MKMKDILKEGFLKVGQEVTFQIKNTPSTEFHGYSFKKEIQPYNNKKCKIINIEQESNNYTNSYYTIRFPNGHTIEGVSGFHLM